MADNGRWFKLWCSAISDPDMQNMEIADFGRWCVLGAYTKEHGNSGVIMITPPARFMCSIMQTTSFEHLISVITLFPNVMITEGDNGVFTVSFKNWRKYQEDSTGYKRLKAWRQRQNDNAKDNGGDNAKDNGDKKRREEKRREERRNIRNDNANDNANKKNGTGKINVKAKEIIARYCELFKEKYGKSFIVQKKDAGISQRLATVAINQDIDIVLAIEKFFHSSDPFILRSQHSFNIIESQLNKLLINAQGEPMHPSFVELPAPRKVV